MAAVTLLLDTNIFLNVKNKEDPYYRFSRKVLDSVDDGLIRGVVSTITIVEMCSGYYMAGDEYGCREFRLALLSKPSYKITHVNSEIADRAGKIKAATGLRLPDALILASGLAHKASAIVTHDSEFTKSSSILKPISAEKAVKNWIENSHGEDKTKT